MIDAAVIAYRIRLPSMADQIRGDAMGCGDNAHIHRPNLECLARLRCAYTASPSCLLSAATKLCII